MAEAIATSSEKIVRTLTANLTDSMIGHVVSGLGDDLKGEIESVKRELREFKAEMRALVVARSAGQEKEIAELRDLVSSMAKKVDGGKVGPLPPNHKEKIPQASVGNAGTSSRKAPSYAQAAAVQKPPEGTPTCPRKSGQTRGVAPGDVQILKRPPPARPLPSTIPDSQPMEGVVFNEQGSNTSCHAPPAIPLPPSPPPLCMLNRGISQGYGPATSVIERRDISGFSMLGKKRCHCSECVKCST
jgi:hypothetical protein